MSQMKEENAMRSTPWTLDKTINLPFLISIVCALVSAAVWANGVNTKLETMQMQVSKMEESFPRMTSKLERLDERSLQLQRVIDNIDSGVVRIAK